MIRLLILLAALGAAGAAAGWIADRPGTVEWDWLGTSGELRIGEAIALAAGAAVAVLVLSELVRALWSAPRRIARRAEARRRDRAFAALSDGLVAVASGDLAAARRAAAEAKRAAPDAPLTGLLAAQAAQMAGDRAGAEAHFLAMTQHPQTLLLGLRGLSVEAARAGDITAQRGHARAANRADPALPWAAAAAFDAATAERDFVTALALNDEALRHKLVDRTLWRRRRAVLLTGRAMALGDGEEARKAATDAHDLARDLVPAAVLAARLTAGRARQAAAILDAAYKAAPHPELFAAALDLTAGDSAADRLKRAEALAALRPNQIESALGLAAAARAAREFAKARSALRPFVAERPTQRVCVAMAEIEAADGSGEGVVREWLARAVRAPRDPVWMADGVVSAAWDAVSPVSGALDRYEWRVPEGSPQGPEIDLVALAPQAPPPVAGEIAAPATASGRGPATSVPHARPAD